MQVKRYILGIVLSVIGLGLKAQDITFCLDHTDNGLPLGSGKQFELERFGQDVEILFRASNPLTTERLYFFIDYLQDGKFAEFDTKTAQVNHNRNWEVLSYRFSQTGRYRVLVMNSDKKEICRSEVEIILKEEENSPEYFDGVELVFCNTASRGIADTSLHNVRFRPGEAVDLSVLLWHIRPFKTHHIYVDVWVGSGTGAGNYLETMEFSLDPNWTYSQFPYKFNSAGVYTFRVYNEDEIWMTTGVLEVTMQ